MTGDNSRMHPYIQNAEPTPHSLDFYLHELYFLLRPISQFLFPFPYKLLRGHLYLHSPRPK